MFDLSNPITIQTIIKKHNFAPNKFLGQNFLIDKKVLDKIIETADIKEGDNVIEIGSGLGVLTAALLTKGANVMAIEKDQELIPVLKENLEIHAELSQMDIKQSEPKHPRLHWEPYNPLMHSRTFRLAFGNNLIIVNDDFLALDFGELVSSFGGKPYKVVSNIPYYITSPVLRKILSAKMRPQEIIFLVQREVAERIAAKSGEMSFISVFVQFYGMPSVVEIVKPNSFWPAPKVESAILKIILDKKPALADDELKEFWRLVKIGFSSRRKTLANNLAAGFRAKPAEVRDLLKGLGFSDKTRAQELSVEDWIRLFKEDCGARV